MADLFDTDTAAKLQRLRELGWRQLERFGREYWEHPVTLAWHSEAEALKWLEGQKT